VIDASDDAPAASDLWHDVSRRGSHAAMFLATRTVLLRGLTFAGTIVLARLLAPADFGIYAMVSLVVSVWAALGDFGLGAALVQQQEEPTPTQLATAWTAQQAIALVSTGVVWLTAPAITAAFPGLPSDAPWMLRILALGLPISSLRTLPSVMMERELRFGPLAVAEVMQTATSYSVAIGLAAFGGGVWSFVIAGVAQLAVGTLMVNLAWRRLPQVGLDRDCLVRLVQFGFDYQTSVVMVSLRDAPLPVIAGVVAGTVSAGLVQFATRIALTVASIDEVIARIAFPAFSRLQARPGEQSRALDAAVMLTALLVVPVQCWIATAAPVLVPAIFGAQWTGAVVPIQIMCIGMLFRFPTRYIRQAVFACGESRLGMVMSAVATILAIVCFGTGCLAGGLPGGAVGFLAGTAAGLAATGRMARTHVPEPGWRAFTQLVGAGLVAAAAAFLGQYAGRDLGSAAATILGAAIYAAVFGVLVWTRHRDLARLCWRLVRLGSGWAPVARIT
jgi:O-antigen/teichoic acid export membrane protein